MSATCLYVPTFVRYAGRMEAVAWWLAVWAMRIVVAALFLATAFGWSVAVLFWLGRFKWQQS